MTALSDLNLRRWAETMTSADYIESKKYQLFIYNAIKIMGNFDKLILKILKGTSDANISFHELTELLKSLGFSERVSGSHHIYRKQGIEEKINIKKVMSIHQSTASGKIGKEGDGNAG